MLPVIVCMTTVCFSLLVLFLLTIYLLARCPRFARGLVAWCDLLTILTEMLETGALRVSQLCAGISQRLLWQCTNRNSDESERDVSLIGVCIARLIYLALSLCILLGDLPLLEPRAALLYNLPQTNGFAGPITRFLTYLWLTVPILFSCLFTDGLLVPRQFRLFPQLDHKPKVRFLIGSISFVLLLGTLVLNAGFNAIGQCLIIQSAVCTPDPSLQITIAASFAVFVVIAGVFAFAATICGLMAFVSLLFSFCSCYFAVCSFVSRLLKTCFQVFSWQLRASLDPLVKLSAYRIERLAQGNGDRFSLQSTEKVHRFKEEPKPKEE